MCFARTIQLPAPKTPKPNHALRLNDRGLFAKHLHKTIRHLGACCCGELAEAFYHATLVYGSYLVEHHLSLFALK